MSGEAVLELEGVTDADALLAELEGHSDTVQALAFSADGRLLASGRADKTVKLWDTRTAKLKQSWELRWPIFDVTFTPDGRHFLTANANSTVYIFRPGPASGDALAAR